jgi:hypothetical protein
LDAKNGSTKRDPIMYKNKPKKWIELDLAKKGRKKENDGNGKG